MEKHLIFLNNITNFKKSKEFVEEFIKKNGKGVQIQVMLSIENSDLREIRNRIHKANNMFSLAYEELDVDIAIAEKKLAELYMCRLLREMKETETKK